MIVAIITAAMFGSALAWPVTASETLEYQETTATNHWCGYNYSTSFGNLMVGQAKVRVDFGGTCNADWGRPAGWIKVRMKSINAQGMVIATSATILNAANASLAQITMTHTNAAAYDITTYFRKANGTFFEQTRRRLA